MRLIYNVHRYDVWLFTHLVNARFHRTLAGACRHISKTGDGPLYVLLGLSFYWVEGWESPLLQNLLLAFSLERPLYFVLKNSFKRNRPPQALENFQSLITPSDHFSFPSGHTSAAFMVATVLGFFLPLLLIPLLFWAALVGFSRVVLGVHFPTDTLVGMMLGVACALVSLAQVVTL